MYNFQTELANSYIQQEFNVLHLNAWAKTLIYYWGLPDAPKSYLYLLLNAFFLVMIIAALIYIVQNVNQFLKRKELINMPHLTTRFKLYYHFTNNAIYCPRGPSHSKIRLVD
jgi:hypothetical protein